MPVNIAIAKLSSTLNFGDALELMVVIFLYVTIRKKLLRGENKVLSFLPMLISIIGLIWRY